jgi:hypothetical protein
MSAFNVNGKAPISVWCPSRDNVGNGTTTLTDLVGSNNGTLTNMDPATDWVADTGAGGIRALDFDGSNDFVDIGNVLPLTSTAFSISFWMLWNGVNANSNRGLIGKYGTGNARGYVIATANTTSGTSEINNVGTLAFYYQSNASSFNNDEAIGTVGTRVDTNTWTHVVATFNPSTRSEIFINGVSARNRTTNVPASIASNSANTEIARYSSTTNCFLGRLDDMRIFNQVLDASDISYLYNSGNGRGRIASSLRRNHAFIGVAF